MAKQQTSKDDPKEAPNEGITAISVQGFKSLAKESRIEIRPLTILAGANSSGKSSIMQPLLLMKQTLEASYDPGPLFLNGPNAKFTSVNQFISRSQKDTDRQSFSVEIEQAEGITHKVAFSITENQTLEIRDMIIDMIIGDGGKHSLRLTLDQSEDDLKNAISKFISKKIKGLKLEVVRNRCFLDVDAEILDDKGEFASPLVREVFVVAVSSELLNRKLRGMIHVPGLRGNPERVYNRTATGPDFAGTFEYYVATAIAQWQEQKDDQLQALETMLAALGLTQEISAKYSNDIDSTGFCVKRSKVALHIVRTIPLLPMYMTKYALGGLLWNRPQPQRKRPVGRPARLVACVSPSPAKRPMRAVCLIGRIIGTI